MSTLREKIKINDFLMDKTTKELFFVVLVESSDRLILRDEKKLVLKSMPNHLVNLSLVKVSNMEAYNVLYKDKGIKNDTN